MAKTTATRFHFRLSGVGTHRNIQFANRNMVKASKTGVFRDQMLLTRDPWIVLPVENRKKLIISL